MNGARKQSLPIHPSHNSVPHSSQSHRDEWVSTTAIPEPLTNAVGGSSWQRLLFVVYPETTSGIRVIGARLATATERQQDEELS